MGNYIFSLIAICQGCFVLGFTVFIFTYYFPKNKQQTKSKMRWHVISVSSSYILLTSLTIRTAILGFYPWGDVWYWIVAVAYLLGDLSLVMVFKDAVRKHRYNDLTDKTKN